jgi:hypothetical protein
MFAFVFVFVFVLHVVEFFRLFYLDRNLQFVSICV